MSLNYMPAHHLAGTPRTGQYYRHSGVVNLPGVLTAALIGAVVAIVGGIVYAYAVRFIPIDKLNALACLGFGCVLGFVPATVLLKRKVRNLPVSLAVIGVVAVLGLYTAWVAWEAIIMSAVTAPHFGPLQRFLHPVAVVQLAVRINEVGTWGTSSVGSSTAPEATKGTALAVIWAVEALTILGVPLAAGKLVLGSSPFCDACDRWCEAATTVRFTAPVDGKVLRQKLEAGDFAHVAALGPPTANGGMEFKRQHCNKCGRLNTLTVTRQSVTRDRKGKVKKKRSTVVINKLLVTPDDLRQMAAPAAT